MGIPDVINHRRSDLRRQFHLPDTHLPLHFSGTVIIIVIQSYLSDSGDFLIPVPPGNFIQILCAKLFRLVGMNSARTASG